VLTAGLESTNAALLAQWEATEAALARARDDVHAAMERQGGEIGSSLAALTEKKISELKVKILKAFDAPLWHFLPDFDFENNFAQEDLLIVILSSFSS
jgi:hypothetical protein